MVALAEWRRGCVLKVSSTNKVALTQHLDFEGETTKVSFNNMKTLVPRFAQLPCQSNPVCQLEGIADAQVKNQLLKPYMAHVIQIEVSLEKQICV